VARHIGKYIPGNPQVIVRNMPGGGGLVMTNYVANVANKEQCAALIVTQMLGLAFTRYILHLPPVVNLSRAALEEHLGTTIQHYLRG